MTDTNQRDTEKIMQLRYEIPDTFWSLFRSVNREIYMESLLVINEEYQYSNYFLTKEICVQVLSDMNAQKQVLLQREENETDDSIPHFTVAFKDRMAEEDRRLQYDDHKYCDTGLCGGFY